VDVDALDAAARLAGIEERAVDQILDSVTHVGIGTHIGRVLAAELEADADEPAGRGLLDRPAARHRSGEAHHVGKPARDDRRHLVVAQHQVLEHALGQAGGIERRLEPLGDQQRAGGVLEHHRVAGHQCRHHRVHRRQERVVPGRDRKHHAERLALDVAREAVPGLRHHVRETFLGDRDHVPRPLLEAAQLARAEAHGPAHLPGELRHDLVRHGQHGVDRLRAIGAALGDRKCAPCPLRGTGALECGRDRGLARQRTFGIDAAVHRRYAFHCLCHDVR
jgi:hypothetical protein